MEQVVRSVPQFARLLAIDFRGRSVVMAVECRERRFAQRLFDGVRLLVGGAPLLEQIEIGIAHIVFRLRALSRCS